MGVSVFGSSSVLGDGRKAHNSLTLLLQVASYFSEFRLIHSLIPHLRGARPWSGTGVMTDK